MLDEISRLLARHKLIPFLGAGISRRQLGVGAPELRLRLAERLSEPPPKDCDLAAVAQRIEDTFGSEALVMALRSHLCREQFDDATGTGHLLILSLNCGLVYTTNQDNLFELASVRYKHPHKVIITVRDLAEAEPGQRLLVKFHGDLSVLESLVFTSSSYANRMNGPDNALDIRLRSDLLGKGLLFIGYSLQDENLRELLREIQRAFHGGTPTSYMVAFDYQPGMEVLALEFGVKVVNPRALFPDYGDNATAFECCLQTLCEKTMRMKTEKDLENLFSIGESTATVLIEHELVALERTIAKEDFASGLKAFRASADATVIPPHLQRRVAEAFVAIAEKAASDDDLRELRGGLFNLNLEPVHAVVAMAGYMAANHVRKVSTGWDGAHLIASPSMPEEMWPLAAAHAVDMLAKGGYPITDGFRQAAAHWFEDFAGLSDEGEAFVRQQIEVAWRGSRMESPLALAARLGPMRKSLFKPKKFREIVADMERSLPHHFPLPKDLA